MFSKKVKFNFENRSVSGPVRDTMVQGRTKNERQKWCLFCYQRWKLFDLWKILDCQTEINRKRNQWYLSTKKVCIFKLLKFHNKPTGACCSKCHSSMWLTCQELFFNLRGYLRRWDICIFLEWYSNTKASVSEQFDDDARSSTMNISIITQPNLRVNI